MSESNQQLRNHERVESMLKQLLRDLENDNLDLDLYTDFQREMKDLIFEEETIIFQYFLDQKSYGKEILGFETEHAAIWRLLDLINSEIETSKFLKINKYFNEMFMILLIHNEREEKYIYSKLRNYDGIDVLRPSDWVCKRRI